MAFEKRSDARCRPPAGALVRLTRRFTSRMWSISSRTTCTSAGDGRSMGATVDCVASRPATKPILVSRPSWVSSWYSPHGTSRLRSCTNGKAEERIALAEQLAEVLGCHLQLAGQSRMCDRSKAKQLVVLGRGEAGRRDQIQNRHAPTWKPVPGAVRTYRGAVRGPRSAAPVPPRLPRSAGPLRSTLLSPPRASRHDRDSWNEHGKRPPPLATPSVRGGVAGLEEPAAGLARQPLAARTGWFLVRRVLEA